MDGDLVNTLQLTMRYIVVHRWEAGVKQLRSVVVSVITALRSDLNLQLIGEVLNKGDG